MIKYTIDPEFGEKTFFFEHVHIACVNQLSLHQQDSWELSYIITGRGLRMIGDMTEPFLEGEIVLIPPNIPHCWSFDESVYDKYGKIENITVVFTNELLFRCEELFEELKPTVSKLRQTSNAISFSGQTLGKLQQILLQMKSEPVYEQIASLMRLIGLIAHPDESNVVGHPIVEDLKSKRMQSIYLYVMNNYQYPISLYDIAQFAGMERSAFCVFFKKMTKKSFFYFLTDYRIEAACQMMLRTTKTIAEICLTSGFRDVPYFNRAFKKAKKITPSEYRRLYKKTNVVTDK